MSFVPFKIIPFIIGLDKKVHMLLLITSFSIKAFKPLVTCSKKY